jgi:hypothetical protein
MPLRTLRGPPSATPRSVRDHHDPQKCNASTRAPCRYQRSFFEGLPSLGPRTSRACCLSTESPGRLAAALEDTLVTGSSSAHHARDHRLAAPEPLSGASLAERSGVGCSFSRAVALGAAFGCRPGPRRVREAGPSNSAPRVVSSATASTASVVSDGFSARASARSSPEMYAVLMSATSARRSCEKPWAARKRFRFDARFRCAVAIASR